VTSFAHATDAQHPAEPEPEVTFGPLPAGQLYSAHRDDDGQLHAVIDTCPAYDWCREPAGHEFHASEAARVDYIGRNPSPECFVEAFLMAEDGRDGAPGIAPLIAVGESDLTPDQAHDVAARIRQFADQLDAMANTAKAAG
jgi:hypothetical protein